MSAARVRGALRLGWAVALLAVPGRLLHLTAGSGDDTPAARRVVRVLGARHAAQAAAELLGSQGSSRLGVAVDAAHGLSMVALAARSGRWRRPATLSAAVASSFAVAGWMIARSSG
jgi:hypothetical protein